MYIIIIRRRAAQQRLKRMTTSGFYLINHIVLYVYNGYISFSPWDIKWNLGW